MATPSSKTFHCLNECEDVIVRYPPNCNECGIVVLGDESSYVLMKYCPWCGGKLARSKRGLWVEIIGVLEYVDEEIPSILNTDEWHKSLPDVEGMTPQKVIKELGLKPKPENSR